MIMFLLLLVFVLGAMYFFLKGFPSGTTTGPASGTTTGPASGTTTGPASGTTTGPASGTTTGPAGTTVVQGPKNLKNYTPSKIVIIREANSGKKGLNDAGIKRATTIADWASPIVSGGIKYEGELIKLTNQRVAAIYTLNPDNTSGDYNAVLTAQPTSFQLQIPLYTLNDRNNTQELLNAIYSNPMVQGKTVLIVWDYKYIQKLMKDMGLTSPFWNDYDHARVILVEGDKSGYVLACQGFDDIIDNTDPVRGRLDSAICAENLQFKPQI
jgi:hypothetical protein